MKPSAFRIERMLEKLEAALVPPERKCLQVIIDGDDEVAVTKKKKEAVAEHVARHPESRSHSQSRARDSHLRSTSLNSFFLMGLLLSSENLRASEARR
jgi:hypothetical protein